MAGSDEGAGPVPYAELVVLDPLPEQSTTSGSSPVHGGHWEDAWGRSSGIISVYAVVSVVRATYASKDYGKFSR